jgi:hypothetical protein
MIHRRRFLTAFTTAPFLSRIQRCQAAATFDPVYGSATDAATAIRTRVIYSRELTAHVFEHIRKRSDHFPCSLADTIDDSVGRRQDMAWYPGRQRFSTSMERA